MLIESALPLSVFGIVAATFLWLPATAASNHEAYSVAQLVFEALFWSFIMIIFRVTTGRSWSNFPRVKDGVILSTINFAAHPTAESSFFRKSHFRSDFGRDAGADAEHGGTSNDVTIARSSCDDSIQIEHRSDPEKP
ncbi:hypothetical protein EST38_g13639 [Candolleomyces aberdarensis]|uniref:Uncharacterized protein n=1 Tax=Candolleomyces aberdarensis TaxID=2316362 RepID=A0A4Q2D250_9AGAR|nr:hypothetical protein EST38_g13639 [Candolleomyces aberdarensis]